MKCQVRSELKANAPNPKRQNIVEFSHLKITPYIAFKPAAYN